jgi:formate hydrogenlyase transcriptional activator
MRPCRAQFRFERLDIPMSELDEGIRTAAMRRSQRTLEEAERAHILATLKETRWILSGPRGAARRLGLHRSTLQFRMKKLGIERPMPVEDQDAGRRSG